MLKQSIIVLFSIYGLTSANSRILLQATAPAPVPAPAPATAPQYELGAHGQQCPIAPTSADNQCQSTTDIVSDANTGILECNLDGDCCMCSSIGCGLGTAPCTSLRIGPSAALGVKDIQIIGSDTDIGAVIECYGADSCKNSIITARNVAEIICVGESACEGARILIIDPMPDFTIDCPVTASCKGLEVNVRFTKPVEPCPPLDPTAASAANPPLPFAIGGVECGSDMSCDGLSYTLHGTNRCEGVGIDEISCAGKTGCNAARFNLIGDVNIMNCKCGAACDTATGLEQCYIGPRKLECSDPEQCMRRTVTYFNPANYFEFVCGSTESCKSSQFTLELNQNAEPKIRNWKGFIIGGPMAASGATFTIDNKQLSDIGAPIILSINAIECGGHRSCEGATFIKGKNVEIGGVICSAGNCEGCTVKESAIDPVGVPCYDLLM